MSIPHLALVVVIQVLVPVCLVGGQYLIYQPFNRLHHQGGPYLETEKPVSCTSPKQTFPLNTNSTPLFQVETPYKKVDTRRAVADMFSDAIEAKDNENAFDLISSGLVLNTQAGTVNAANSLTWPKIRGEGISIVGLKAPPCSVGIPHYHGVNEIAYVTAGSNITVGIKENLKPLNLMKNIRTGNVIFLPQLSIHFFINLNCNEVLEGVQIWPTDKVSTTIVGPASMNLPSEILQAAYNTDIEIIEAMKTAKLEETESARLDPYCLQRCGLL